jgi:HAD superfamily hydrolase (TIGR01509 family)
MNCKNSGSFVFKHAYCSGPHGALLGFVHREALSKTMDKKATLYVGNQAVAHNVELMVFDQEGTLFDTVSSEQISVLPGVENLLKQCERHHVKAAIATSASTENTYAHLAHAALTAYFDEVIGRDKASFAKPHPEMIETILLHTQCRKEHAVMVGDHPRDLLMARAAGISTLIAVLTGFGLRREFDGIDCHVVDTLEELTLR